jgi:hypothetical protein
MSPPTDPIPAAAAEDAPAPAPRPGERLPSPLFVGLSLSIALVLTLVTVGLVGWRWLVVRFPNAALVARGDAAADGVEIVVRTEDGREVARGHLSAANQYEFPVLVEEGVYAVRASRDGKAFQERRYFVPNARGVLADVAAPPPDTRPATRPATGPSPRP